MTQPPAPNPPQPFNRTSFITLNSNRLFTAKEVATLIQKHSAASPIPAVPESIRPKPDCFGKWQGLDSEKCKACIIWGYCADVEEAAAQARADVLDEIQNWLCEKEEFAGMDKEDNFEVYVVSSSKIRRKLESLRNNPSTQQEHR